jgi:predicted NUDIX family NTP pyrophosphohydrolase
MPKQSAGILLYHFDRNVLKVFLVHPGGPFWKNKDEGAWSIPKGEFTEEEEALSAAKREFMEETGMLLKAEHFIPLKPVKMKSGKMVFAWAAHGHVIPEEISSNTFEMEWPTGKKQTFPEVDRGAWFTTEEGRKKIIPAQLPFIEELVQKLA